MHILPLGSKRTIQETIKCNPNFRSLLHTKPPSPGNYFPLQRYNRNNAVK